MPGENAAAERQGLATMRPGRPVAYAAALLFTGSLGFSMAQAAAPCDFKGVSVGDKATPAQVMEKFGVTKFVTDPKQTSFEQQLALSKKYTIAIAGEITDWDTGPYCVARYCRVPYGITVGNSNIPVKLFVSFNSGVVTEIDVNFGRIWWDEVLGIITKKYGSGWKTDESLEIVSDYETKKNETVTRIFLEKLTGGVNQATGDTCRIWMNSVDIVWQHHDPLGPFQSVFVIKLDSKNF